MAHMLKPSWLLDSTKLLEIVQHHLFLPQDIPPVTTLQDTTAFTGGLKRFLFWKGQLSPSLLPGIVYLAFLGPQGLKIPDILNVTTALRDIVDLTKILEFYRGADTHFMAISFANKELVAQIISKFKYYEDTIVLAVSYNDVPQHKFKLLWLPPMFDIVRVHHLLEKHTLSHRLRRESVLIANGGYTPTNVISGVITLKPGINASSLPHLIQLPSPHKGCALLTIEGRPPLCLKCREVGHTRQKCSMIKCLQCSKVHFPSSPCGISSYASVATCNITSSTEEDWLDRLNDDDSTSAQDLDDNLLPNHSHNSPSKPLASTNASLIANTPNATLLPNLSPQCIISSEGVRECDRTPAISTGIIISSSTTNITKTPQEDSLTLTPSMAGSSDKFQPIHDDHALINSSISTHLSTGLLSSHPLSTTSNKKVIHRLDASKVHVSEQPSLSSQTARSQIVSYSVAPPTAIATYSCKLPVIDSAPIDRIFGDPHPHDAFSSDSESEYNPPLNMDTSDSSTFIHSSRKRKNFSLYSDGLPQDSDSTSPSDTELSTPNTSSHTPSDLPSLPDVNTIVQLVASSSQRSPLYLQVSCLYGVEDDQIDFLESLCPNGAFTSDILKILKLLSTHGFGLHAILSFPQIVKLRLSDVRKRIKYLEKLQIPLSLPEIWQQSRNEARASCTHPPAIPETHF